MRTCWLLLVLALGSGVVQSQSSGNLPFSVALPTKIAIRLVSSPPAFTLSTPAYPPDNFPAYYSPTNGQGLALEVFSNAPSFSVTASASPDFTPALPVSRLYLGPTSAATPPEGTPAPDPGVWTSFGNPGTQITLLQQSQRTAGYQLIQRNFILQVTSTDQPTTSASTAIIYTITAGV